MIDTLRDQNDNRSNLKKPRLRTTPANDKVCHFQQATKLPVTIYLSRFISPGKRHDFALIPMRVKGKMIKGNASYHHQRALNCISPSEWSSNVLHMSHVQLQLPGQHSVSEDPFLSNSMSISCAWANINAQIVIFPGCPTISNVHLINHA